MTSINTPKALSIVAKYTKHPQYQEAVASMTAHLGAIASHRPNIDRKWAPRIILKRVSSVQSLSKGDMPVIKRRHWQPRVILKRMSFAHKSPLPQNEPLIHNIEWNSKIILINNHDLKIKSICNKKNEINIKIVKK